MNELRSFILLSTCLVRLALSKFIHQRLTSAQVCGTHDMLTTFKVVLSFQETLAVQTTCVTSSSGDKVDGSYVSDDDGDNVERKSPSVIITKYNYVI